jgi:hypothetical protein
VSLNNISKYYQTDQTHLHILHGFQKMLNYRSNLYENSTSIVEKALLDDSPIWRDLSTKDLSMELAISMQTLGNWRVRGIGPKHRLIRKGTKCIYRLDEVLEWLSGIPALQIAHTWLVRRGMAAADLDEEYVEWVKSTF